MLTAGSRSLRLPAQDGEGQQRLSTHGLAGAMGAPAGGCSWGGHAHGCWGEAVALTLSPSPCHREWYGYHFPELIRIVPENSTYCRLARFIGNRRELSEDSLEGLEEIVMDAAKAQAILEASRSSMGEGGADPPGLGED